MKRFLITSLLILFPICFLYSQAIVTKMYIIGGGTSPSFPEKFSEYYEFGYHFGFGIGRSLTKYFTTYGTIEYHHFNFDSDGYRKVNELPDNIPLESNNIGVFLFSATGKIQIPTTRTIFWPYAIAGVGYYISSASGFKIELPNRDPLLLEDYSESVFSVHGGLGVEISLTPQTSIYVDVRYVNALTKDQNTVLIPFRGGIVVDL